MSRYLHLLIVALLCISAFAFPVTESEVADWTSKAVVTAEEASKWNVVKGAVSVTSASKQEDGPLVDFADDTVIFKDKEAEAILDAIVDEIVATLGQENVEALLAEDSVVPASEASMDDNSSWSVWDWLMSDEPLCGEDNVGCLTDEDIAFMMLAFAFCLTPLLVVTTVVIAKRRMQNMAQMQQPEMGYVAVKEVSAIYDAHFPAGLKL